MRISDWSSDVCSSDLMVEALIANARAQKQALMQQLLPQGTTPPKKRLPGFSGDWREAEFNEVFNLKIGGTPARKNPAYWDGDTATQNRWVAISDLQGKYIDETQENISDARWEDQTSELTTLMRTSYA